MFTSFDGSDATRKPVLLGMPFDAASSFARGSADAPDFIRDALASSHSNLWTEGLIDLSAAHAVLDAGDVVMPEQNEQELSIAVERVASITALGGIPVVLGGDHSVTSSALRGLRARQPFHLLVIDAHPDLYHEFEGRRDSHACWCARAIEDKLVSGVTIAGVRTLTGHQRDQAERFGCEIIDMRAWDRGARPSVRGPVYLSVDLDGFDPAHAPGVSHPEPGGLVLRDALRMLDTLDVLVGADVVEYNPRCDVGHLTAVLAAKMVKEICGHIIARGQRQFSK